MDSLLTQSIQDYYSKSDPAEVRPRMARTKENALKLVAKLRGFLPVVSDPIVTDYGKCVEVRAGFDEDAPGLGSGWKAIRDHILETGKPLWEMGIYLSWVGPYARVHLASYSVGPGGEVVVAQGPKDTHLQHAEERVRSEVYLLRYGILTEADLGTPIDVDPKRMREIDGFFDPPTTVGKCLFYPWWGGPEMRMEPQ